MNSEEVGCGRDRASKVLLKHTRQAPEPMRSGAFPFSRGCLPVTMQHLKAMAEIVEANVRQFSIVDRKLTDLSTEAMGMDKYI